jgi:hypothetical protein
MEALNVKQRLEFAVRGVDQLRQLAISQTKMRYEEFARAIGLIEPTEAWHVRYRGQVTAILSIMGAVERQGLGGIDKSAPPLEFDWIINEKGKPGAGFAKESMIIRRKPKKSKPKKRKSRSS